MATENQNNVRDDIMAGKAKSVYVSVAVKGDPFAIVVRKQFFTMGAMRKWKASVMAEFPEAPTEPGAVAYRYTVETY